jgi:hypothetical protein
VFERPLEALFFKLTTTAGRKAGSISLNLKEALFRATPVLLEVINTWSLPWYRSIRFNGKS